jgi:hypothetical protein
MIGPLLLGVTTLATLVAAPDLCRPWATTLSQSVVNATWLRAYTLCLNSDQLPPLPKDWQAALDLIKPGPVPLYKDPPGSVKATDSKVTDSKVTGPTFKACAASHPRGYSSKAHTYNTLQGKKWVAVPCQPD